MAKDPKNCSVFDISPSKKMFMLLDTIGTIEKSLVEAGSLGTEDALCVLEDKNLGLSSLFALTDFLRQQHSGKWIRLCSIINARSGACREDCAFCAQSAHYSTGIRSYPLLDSQALAEEARKAVQAGAGEFSMVTSGPAPGSEKEITVLEEALEKMREMPLSFRRCASLGRIGQEQLRRLKKAGLDCFHHNLEASGSFFPQICTTHTHAERVETVKMAKACGLRICSGGIFGMGEEPADRVALAMELKELGVDSIPLNFLHPIPGTPLENASYLTPEDCLRIIAMFRLVLPDKDIVVCGGREKNLRDLQSMIFCAGANGLLIGNYLTTAGRDVAADLRMLEDLGLEPYVA